MKDVRIEKVKDRKQLKRFILFPWKVYRDDPNWVPPLIIDMRDKLDRKKNPFFEHAEMELYFAYRGNEIVGRVAAIIDDNHNQFHKEKVVFFGLYESFNDPDTADRLLEEVARWGRERGMNVLRGPMNLSMNDECAFLLEGFDSPPVVMMPYNPPYYLELMEKCGLSKAKDLYAFFITKDDRIPDKVREIAAKVRSETKITVRHVDRKRISEETEKIKFVYNHAWEKNWGFVPWTEKEMDHMARRLKQVADLRIVLLAEDKGKPVGFAFALPNYNEVLKRMNGRLLPFGFIKFLVFRKKIKGIRAVVFGILKEYRQTGVSYLLFSELEKNIHKAGYEWCEMSWLLEDNEPIIRFNASLGAKIYKKNRIYEKIMI